MANKYGSVLQMWNMKNKLLLEAEEISLKWNEHSLESGHSEHCFGD